MNIPVIDACVAIKWFLPENNYKEAGEILNSFNRMIIPDLFLIEFDAIVTKKVRQKLVEQSDAVQIIHEIRSIPFDVIPYKLVSKMAFDLSSALPITQYDACYLAAAIEYNEIVVTADKRFFRAIQGTPFESYVSVL